MRRLPYLLTAALVAVILLTGGGYLAVRHNSASPSGSPSGGGSAGDPDRVSSIQVLTQGAPTVAAPSPTTSGPSAAAPSAGSGTTPATPKATRTTPPASSSVVNQLLAQINQLRADNGLPPYTIAAGLNASAHKHNLTMAGGCGLSHQCSGEPDLGKRISAQGVQWRSCGENIGYSGPHPNTTAEIVKAAQGLTTAMYNETPPDDGHRKNLLSTSFRHVGIDVIRDSSGKVWLTQDFSS